jgi:hypothetical protein
MRLIPFWPRRHSYRLVAWRKWAGHRVPLYCCCHCGHQIHLDRWQVLAMPWPMARCHKGVRLSPRELLTIRTGGSLDCYASPLHL